MIASRSSVLTADRLLARVLVRRRVLLAASGTAALLALIVSLLMPRSYTSDVSFLPADQGQAASALAGLASQVGLNIGQGNGGQSPDFYADFLVSGRVLSDLAQGRYRLIGENGLGHDTVLVDYLTPGSQAYRRRLAITVKRLRGHLKAETGANTGVITLRVTFDDPLIATAVAARALALVNRFNVESRQSQAGAQRRFLETQVTKTASDLRAAEDSLLRFLVRNRDYRNSPTLSFEYDRLQRSMTLRQDAYAAVFQAFLQSQATEVQNTPVVTVVAAPAVPAIGNPRHTLLKAFSAALVVLVLLVTWYSLRDAAVDWASGSSELHQAAADARADWHRIQEIARWRLF